jgi:hypothetical protein
MRKREMSFTFQRRNEKERDELRFSEREQRDERRSREWDMVSNV